MDTITSVEQLEAIYDKPRPASLDKEASIITDEYRQLIEASPFMALATVGPGGMDCSPRGDKPAVVHVVDESTLHLPDRRGNNRLDSLRNIVADGRVALLFLIPGVAECLRVNGSAVLRIDPDLLNSYAVDGKPPASVVEITPHVVYFQCARAIKRSELWNPAQHRERGDLPSPGQIVSVLTDGAFDGESYDAALQERQAKTLY